MRDSLFHSHSTPVATSSTNRLHAQPPSHSAVPATAHHSFAMFDNTRSVTLRGQVTEFKWQNPHSFIEADVAARGGTIIGFASDAGRFAAPRQAVIGAAFAGVMGFVRNLAMEVGRNGVRVHCLSPSFVADTPAYAMHADRAGSAIARAGLGLPSPADIAPMALFLCSPGAAKITGQIISINGGLNA